MENTAEKPLAAFAIRPAGENDIERIAQLARRIWPVAYAGILTGEQIANMLLRIYDAENLRKEMQEDGHRFWIASIRGEDIGYASGYREKDTAWIKKIYVHPDHKGLGLGRSLIDTIAGAFQPAREIRLLVNPNNAPAMNFYRHIGFVEIGRKPVQMGDYAFEDHMFARPVTRI